MLVASTTFTLYLSPAASFAASTSSSGASTGIVGRYPGIVSISTLAPTATAPAKNARSVFSDASRIAFVLFALTSVSLT